MKLTNNELIVLISLVENEISFFKNLDDKLYGRAVKESKIYDLYVLTEKLSDELDKRGDINGK